MRNFIVLHETEVVAGRRGLGMTRNIGAAIVLGAALVLAAMLNGGLYETHVAGEGVFFWRTNRFTGAITICVVQTGGAGPVCYNPKPN
jgi:hypothetical protein